MDTECESRGVRALDRAMRLLNRILQDDGVRALPEISAELGIPVSTAHRIAALLVRRKLLIRAKRGRYVAAYAWTTREPDNASRALSLAALPFLERLAARTGATTHLGILDGDMVTYLLKEECGAGPSLITRQGMQLEAYCSAIGKILLADLPKAALDSYLANGPFVALTPNTLTDPAEIAVHLDKVRDEQYATDDCEVADDLYCLAVPVRAPNGKVIAAISQSQLRRPVSSTDRVQLNAVAHKIALQLFDCDHG